MNPRPDSKFADQFISSPNHGERLLPTIDCIILHYTGLRTEARDAWTLNPGAEAMRWLCNSQAQVSCHYIIDVDGCITQLVAETRRAWHAGQSRWYDCIDINSSSIGIEIVNTGHEGGLPAYPEIQIHSVINLCRDIAMRYQITPGRILAHSDIAPERKADPGEHFPWDVLFQAGVGLWVEPEPVREGPAQLRVTDEASVAALRGKLAGCGYDIDASGAYDQSTEKVVRAFQRHFRPAMVDGIADTSTLLTLDRLIEAKARSDAAHSAAIRDMASGS